MQAHARTNTRNRMWNGAIVTNATIEASVAKAVANGEIINEINACQRTRASNRVASRRAERSRDGERRRKQRGTPAFSVWTKTRPSRSNPLFVQPFPHSGQNFWGLPFRGSPLDGQMICPDDSVIPPL